MNIIFVLIPLGLMLLAAAIWAFFWAVGNGQFDDLDAPAVLVLFDEEPASSSAGETQRPVATTGGLP